MEKTLFDDGDAEHGVDGTQVTAGFLNAVQNHRHDGKDQDGSAPLDYAADTGAANALAITLVPPLTAHVIGLPLQIMVGHANTDACTLSVDGLDPKPLVKHGADPLVVGDLTAGQVIIVVYDGVNYQLINDTKTPVKINVSATDLATLDLLLSAKTSGTWYTWDLSSYLPAGATRAIIMVEWISTNACSHKLMGRPNGSSAAGTTFMSMLNPYGSPTNLTYSNQIIVPLANLKFDYSFTNIVTGETSEVKLYLQGWIG